MSIPAIVQAIVQPKIRLAPYTSWQIGGEAEYFALPTKIDEIKELQRWAQEENLPIHLLGGGSNVLIPDEGLSGLTICLKQFNDYEMSIERGKVFVRCSAGVSKSELLRVFLKQKLAPALFLAGLPGDVAGGVVMNAGVAEMIQPREFNEIVDSIEILRPDGTTERMHRDQITWTYRHSSGWQPGIIVSVTVNWDNIPTEDTLKQVRDFNRARLSKQPLDLPSCGSVFVNPPGQKAAQLIDSCGLKGFRVGGVEVSKKHANFIVNIDRGKATDVIEVIRYVRRSVFNKTGVKLHTEVVWMGENSPFKEEP